MSSEQLKANPISSNGAPRKWSSSDANATDKLEEALRVTRDGELISQMFIF